MNELMSKIKSLSSEEQKKIFGEIVKFKDANEVAEMLKKYGVQATADAANALLDNLKGKVELFADDLAAVAGGRVGSGKLSALGDC